MSVGLRILVTSSLKEGVTSDSFREFGGRAGAKVEGEPGTTVYNWWLGEDGTVINEDGYADEAAFGIHMAHMAEGGLLDEWMSLVDVKSVQALGDVGPATREALAGFGAAHYSLIHGR